MIGKFALAIIVGGVLALSGCEKSAVVEHGLIKHELSGIQATPGKTLMFFWYGCPHCYRVHQNIVKQGIKDRFDFVPVPGNENWTEVARAYFVMKRMGVLQRLDDSFFDFVVKDGSKPSRKEIEDFMTANNVNSKEYDSLVVSKEVDEDIDLAKQKAEKYGVHGVPSIFIDGNKPLSIQGAASYEQIVTTIADYYKAQ